MLRVQRAEFEKVVVPDYILDKASVDSAMEKILTARGMHVHVAAYRCTHVEAHDCRRGRFPAGGSYGPRDNVGSSGCVLLPCDVGAD